jgi:hypothetical protein
VAADARTGAALERVADLGPWSAVGDGETLEDSLFQALTTDGEPHCPNCGLNVPIPEEQLANLAHEVLASW